MVTEWSPRDIVSESLQGSRLARHFVPIPLTCLQNPAWRWFVSAIQVRKPTLCSGSHEGHGVQCSGSPVPSPVWLGQSTDALSQGWGLRTVPGFAHGVGRASANRLATDARGQTCHSCDELLQHVVTLLCHRSEVNQRVRKTFHPLGGFCLLINETQPCFLCDTELVM